MLYKGRIAFFDSGIGGLTTLNECVVQAKTLSLYSQFLEFYYYGDNFRAPYGNLPKAKIKEYVFEAFTIFEKLRVDAVVIACNTATAICIDDLRKRYQFPIVGIEPAVSYAAKLGGEIFVLATQATCHSVRFQNLCNLVSLQYPNARIRLFPCAELAGAIERVCGREDYDYTKYLPKGSPDCVVLGCTHYVYIKDKIKEFYGCDVVDGNYGVAKRLFTLLNEQIKKGLLAEKLELSTTEKLRANDLLLQNHLMVNPPKIFFVGEAKVVNKQRYEQMFVVENG